MTDVSPIQMANAIRALSMDAVQQANSGHPGMPMGMADVAAVLFSDILKYDPKHPNWPDRDRFVLSVGHGSMLLYSLLYLTGYDDIDIEQIKQFRQMGARTAGHPEYGYAGGIETTTGPLGQGIANAVGMAMAERALNAEYGDDLVDHYTYCIVGDGCLMEGISQEAISMAGHLKLSKLIVLFDDNGICIDGPTSMTTSEDHIKRFEACGWEAVSIDGHDPAAIFQAISSAKVTDKPTMIACKTTIAKGAPTKAGKNSSHGSPLGEEEINGVRLALNWPHAPFDVPEDILAAWRSAGAKGAAEFDAWTQRFDASDKQAELTARITGELGDGWQEAVRKLKLQLAVNQPKEATRKSSENVINAIAEQIPALLGGSADLTGSNNTKSKQSVAFNADNYAGRYVHYGIREHAMAAAMNGVALHGGFVPFGGTFLVFTDYCRHAIRLSALMKQRVIYVMTHDSIGLGEDGPTHQPIEHLASLRAMPNVNVFRPADATETAEAWALALASPERPSVLALSRQGVSHLRQAAGKEVGNLSSQGAYVLREEQGKHQVTLIGTGTEVHLCVQAAEQLNAAGIGTRVVSMPCWELFDEQTESYRERVLGDEEIAKVACEAAIGFGWEKWLGSNGRFIGMQGFGESAPAPELYEHFGITIKALVDAAKAAV